MTSTHLIDGRPDGTLRDSRGRLVKGTKPLNVKGRPPGARDKLARRFVEDVQDAWERHGRAVLAEIRERDPAAFARLVAGLMPSMLAVSVEHSLSPEERRARLAELTSRMGYRLVEQRSASPHARTFTVTPEEVLETQAVAVLPDTAETPRTGDKTRAAVEKAGAAGDKAQRVGDKAHVAGDKAGASPSDAHPPPAGVRPYLTPTDRALQALGRVSPSLRARILAGAPDLPS